VKSSNLTKYLVLVLPLICFAKLQFAPSFLRLRVPGWGTGRFEFYYVGIPGTHTADAADRDAVVNGGLYLDHFISDHLRATHDRLY